MIHHSDHGSQYTSLAFGQGLEPCEHSPTFRSHLASPNDLAKETLHPALNRLALLLFSVMFFGLVTVGCAQTSPGQNPSSRDLATHFIDVGQGDSVFIQAPTGQGVLYDGGRKSQVPLEYLKSLSITQVDLVIASHQDADHIAGLAAVVDYYKPKFFRDNGIPHTTQTYFDTFFCRVEDVVMARPDGSEPLTKGFRELSVVEE